MTRLGAGVAVVCALLVLTGTRPAGAARQIRNITVSRCPGRNSEVEQAVDGRYVYEVWIGCRHGIGFARSNDGGRTFGPSRSIPGSRTSRFHGWDPAIAVAPDHTVYVSYMTYTESKPSGVLQRESSPAVVVSHDRGRSFGSAVHLPVPTPSSTRGNFGDRDFVAVGPDGTVYVTWDYGPSFDEVRIFCPRGGSCAYSAGDFNAVVQKSPDGGKTWTMPAQISPGFPLGGVYSAPVVAEPNGTLDVLYWQHPTDPSTLAVSPGTQYFTRSTDGGTTWSRPVPVDPGAGTTALTDWWIDGDLAVDPAGNLYASWDTQRGRRDTAWLAWSTDGGASWSPPLLVTSSRAENLVEVAAEGPRDLYVAWQTPVAGKGYATFLRRLSAGRGWTSRPLRISAGYGKAGLWPGDTFGISVERGRAYLSWGSATGGSKTSEIHAASAVLP